MHYYLYYFLINCVVSNNQIVFLDVYTNDIQNYSIHNLNIYSNPKKFLTLNRLTMPEPDIMPIKDKKKLSFFLYKVNSFFLKLKHKIDINYFKQIFTENYIFFKKIVFTDSDALKLFLIYLWKKFNIKSFIKSIIFFIFYFFLILGVIFFFIFKKLKDMTNKIIIDPKNLIQYIGLEFFYKYESKNSIINRLELKDYLLKDHYEPAFNELTSLLKGKNGLFFLVENFSKINKNDFQLILKYLQKILSITFHIKELINNLNQSTDILDKKKYTINILKDVENIFKILLNFVQNSLFKNYNLKLKLIINRILEVVSYSLPVSHRVLKQLITDEFLIAIIKSLDGLIDRVENSKGDFFFKITNELTHLEDDNFIMRYLYKMLNPHKKDIFFKSIPTSEFNNITNLFDEEFFITLIEEIRIPDRSLLKKYFLSQYEKQILNVINLNLQFISTLLSDSNNLMQIEKKNNEKNLKTLLGMFLGLFISEKENFLNVKKNKNQERKNIPLEIDLDQLPNYSNLINIDINLLFPLVENWKLMIKILIKIYNIDNTNIAFSISEILHDIENSKIKDLFESKFFNEIFSIFINIIKKYPEAFKNHIDINFINKIFNKNESAKNLKKELMCNYFFNKEVHKKNDVNEVFSLFEKVFDKNFPDFDQMILNIRNMNFKNEAEFLKFIKKFIKLVSFISQCKKIYSLKINLAQMLEHVLTNNFHNSLEKKMLFVSENKSFKEILLTFIIENYKSIPYKVLIHEKLSLNQIESVLKSFDLIISEKLYPKNTVLTSQLEKNKTKLLLIIKILISSSSLEINEIFKLLLPEPEMWPIICSNMEIIKIIKNKKYIQNLMKKIINILNEHNIYYINDLFSLLKNKENISIISKKIFKIVIKEIINLLNNTNIQEEIKKIILTFQNKLNEIINSKLKYSNYFLKIEITKININTFVNLVIIFLKDLLKNLEIDINYSVFLNEICFYKDGINPNPYLQNILKYIVSIIVPEFLSKKTMNFINDNIKSSLLNIEKILNNFELNDLDLAIKEIVQILKPKFSKFCPLLIEYIKS